MTTIQLWLDKSAKKVDPALFSSRAEELARKIGNDGGNNENKSTQLRRYFDEVVRLDAQARAAGADMNLILPQVHMLVAKVAYAKGRKLVSDSFVEMIRSSISQINDRDDLHVFTNFLEAFMGFYKMYRPR